MKIFLILIICVMQQYCHVLTTPPAPVNLSVQSLNFWHTLRWDPGPGTPSGTTYVVNCRNCGKRFPRHTNKTRMDMTKLLPDFRRNYMISVQAKQGDAFSPWTNKSFCPFSDTTLGPPWLSVSGCGDCLRLNITLPRGNSSKSIEEIYKNLSFHIHLTKAGEKVMESITSEKYYTMNNLESEVEYCVKVCPDVQINQNWLCSVSKCEFTSPVVQSPVPAVMSVWGVILVLAGMSLFGLIYTGYLCRLKTRLPNVLMFPVEANFFISQGAVSDPILDLCSVKETEDKPGLLRDSSDEEEEEEEEEDEGRQDCYEKWGGSRLCVDANSSDTSCGATGSAASFTAIAIIGSGSSGNPSPVVVPTILGLKDESSPEGEGWEECRGSGATTVTPRLTTDIQKSGPAEHREQGAKEHCPDVNLLSVNLGGLEEDGDMADHLGGVLGGQGECLGEDSPLLTAGAILGSPGQANALIETDATPTPLSSIRGHTEYMLTDSGAEQEHSQCSLENEEEDDDEYSGYMRR